jgi:predicted DNA-binding transcriptional regulator YafY
MTKTEQAMHMIREYGYINAALTKRIAGELEISRTTVYRAIRQLRDMNALDGETFTGRFVQPDELVATISDMPLMITDALAAALMTTEATLDASIAWAERVGAIKPVRQGLYRMYVAA